MPDSESVDGTLREYTKSHWIVYFKMVKMLNFVSDFFLNEDFF